MRWIPLLWMVACAYPRALNQAEELVQAGANREAVAAYDRALRARPRSDEARQGRLAVLDMAVAEALTEAEGDLARRDWEAALDAIAYALRQDPESDEALALKGEWISTMADWVAEAVDDGRFEEAYGRVARARTLLPEQPQFDTLATPIREHFLALSERRLAESSYRDALVVLAPIWEHEPDRKDQLTSIETRVRETWAQTLSQEAERRADNAQLGSALALRTRAHEIAGRPVDRDVSQDLRRRLHALGRVSVSVSYHGDAERGARLQTRVTDALAPVAGMVLRPAGTIEATVWAYPAACSQGAATWVAEQPYVSGQHQVDNPRFAPLSSELAALRGAEHVDAGRADQLRYELGAAGQQESSARVDLAPLLSALDEALVAQSSAQAGVAAAQRHLTEAQAQADRFQSDPQQHGHAMLVVHHATAFLQQEEQALVAATAEVDRLQPGVRDAQLRVDAAAAAAAALTQHLNVILAARGSSQARIQQLEFELSQTPRTLLEDVVDVFRYEVQRVTRRCGGAVEVTVGSQVTWSREAPFETVDDTHAAWPSYGVERNPLVFPATDSALLASGDDALGTEIATALAEAADRHAVQRVRAACDALATQPEDALQTLMASALATPASIDAHARARLQTYLEDTYELVDASALLP